MTRRPVFASTLLSLIALVIGSEPIHAQGAVHRIGIDTTGSATSHFGLPATPLHTSVTQVRLRFDSDLSSPPAAGFRVVEAGADGALATLACLVPLGADDLEVDIVDVHWNAALREATLQLDAPRGLPRGRYRVLACDSLRSLAGIALDGDGDGLPGGNARDDFLVEETPALENPGFDRSLDGWTVSTATGSASAAHAPLADADGAVNSGALRAIAPGPNPALTLAHAGCIELYTFPGWLISNWRTSLRHRVVHGSVRVTLQFWTGFSGDQGETDCRGPGFEDEIFFEAQAAPTFATYDSGWRPFLGMPLAQLRVHVSSRDGQPFEILFDDFGLSFDSRVIFRDDFD